VIVRGEPSGGKFSVVYLRDGRLAAVDTIANLADFRTVKRLIAQGARIDPLLAADPGLPLAEAICGTRNHSDADLAATRS
jgi:3-phenylpropionate/trans-cinnamate dioxygenase ferredoxin reductase subunit